MNLRDKVLAYLYDKREGTAEEIAKDLNEEVDYVQATLRVLENEKLVRKTEKGFLRKKVVYELTPTGLEEGQKAYNKVKEKANEFEQIVVENGEVPEEYADLIPLFMTLSLIEATLLQDLILLDIFDNL